MLPYRTLMTPLLICCQAAWSAAEDVKLSFPENRNCGMVSIGTQPTASLGWTNFFEQRDYAVKAQGVVSVPHDAFIELDVNRIGAAELSFLNRSVHR